MEIHNTLVFFVNGKKITDKHAKPEWTLLYYLRNKLNLCGTKLGCGEGGCGACTVMISKYNKNRHNGKVIHLAVNACLAPVCAMHGLAVTTVEGIGSTKTKLHPVQERIAKAHGSQCGFCTPGIVMSMYSLLRNMPKPSMHDLEVAFQGNLCRCTGYRPIIEAYKTFVDEDNHKYQNGNGFDTKTNGFCSLGENCCKNKKIQDDDKYDEGLYDKRDFLPYDPSQEPIFPPELKVDNIYNDQYLEFRSENITWYRPQTLEQLLDLKTQYPHAKIVIGNTEIGIEMKNNCNLYPIIIHASEIQEFNNIIKTPKGIEIGAAVSLQELENNLKNIIKAEPKSKTKLYQTIVNMLHWFASKQIRNVGSVGGNLMNSSPISDLNPIFASANIVLQVVCTQTKMKRNIIVDEHFFTGYRKNLVGKSEILIALFLPFSIENQYYYAIKQSKRRDDDIAIVNMALYLELEPKSNTIIDIRIFFGGMAPITVGALTTRQKLIGKIWTDDIINIAYESLLNDLPLAENAPGGMVQYRKTLTLSLFFKGYMHVTNELGTKKSLDNDDVNVFKQMSSSQYFTKSKNNDTVGQPIVHRAAFKQATGEAVYCDDIPKTEDELYLAHVLSTRSHAKIISIDHCPIYKLDGVVAFFSEKDLPKQKNKFGTIHVDQNLFARDEVMCFGQIVGIVVAKTKEIAKKAAQLVEIEYEDLPVIVTIDEAIAAKSFLPGYPKLMERGDPDSMFKNVEHIIHKQHRLNGQDHFYLETHCTLAMPIKEDDEMVIYSSTQDPASTSRLIANMLSIPCNRVVTKVKRMGGGFGGKETACYYVSLPCALAAYKLNQPVRCMLDRDEDMLITGGRNPFLFDYKVGFNSNGKLEAIDVKIYANVGHCFDLSGEVLVRAMYHVFNTYKISNYKITGYACQTNLPSNTAFRGFGGPQAVYAAESMIRFVAEFLQKDIIDVMNLNLCDENYIMQYGQLLDNCTIQACVDECLDRSDFYERRIAVEQFNKKSKWKKRGISLVPCMFGVGYDAPFLNQAGALVHVYTDGSVSLFHGGTEMGQGLHTKMIQIASKVLDIPISYIHISETATDKVPNSISTAASCSSDINGMAVFNACQVISDRIKPFREANSKGQWSDWVNDAFMARVSLSATGYYRTPNLRGYKWDNGRARPYNYISYGAGCSEVEIDCLTGDHKVLRTDIVMDLGESLNPAIDVGQIEGAFLQGYGLFTMEELLYTPTGRMLTRGPSNYKIPSFSDIPLQFNVTILKGVSNPRAVYSSKAVGEPPLNTSPSVFFAIREGIKSARRDFGLTNTNFIFNAPATVEKIRMACSDDIISKVPMSKEKSTSVWNLPQL